MNKEEIDKIGEIELSRNRLITFYKGNSAMISNLRATGTDLSWSLHLDRSELTKILDWLVDSTETITTQDAIDTIEQNFVHNIALHAPDQLLLEHIQAIYNLHGVLLKLFADHLG